MGVVTSYAHEKEWKIHRSYLHANMGQAHPCIFKVAYLTLAFLYKGRHAATSLWNFAARIFLDMVAFNTFEVGKFSICLILRTNPSGWLKLRRKNKAVNQCHIILVLDSEDQFQTLVHPWNHTGGGKSKSLLGHLAYHKKTTGITISMRQQITWSKDLICLTFFTK